MLLDAACEHAAALAAGHLGLQKIKDVETTMNQLREHLPSWQPQGWKGALELRGQRNQAQHRGTRPDPRDVARWVDDAEAFVRSLVRVAFDVELGEVMVADAVEDLDVRRLIGAAEQALDRQDYAEAKYSAVDAFEAARSRWRGARPRSGVPWYDRREQYVPEGVTADLERLREQAEVQPFASDYGEYLWLMNQHRRYAPVGARARRGCTAGAGVRHRVGPSPGAVRAPQRESRRALARVDRAGDVRRPGREAVDPRRRRYCRR